MAGGLADDYWPSAQELLDQTGGPFPWKTGDAAPADFDLVRFDEDPNRQRGDAADLSVIPTATTNPDRPRTLAAGYDKKLQTLTVMFRDNNDGEGPILYNYYDVDPLTWSNFKRARSKGRFILAYLDSHDRGRPTAGSVSQPTREFLGDVASEYQDAQGGLQPGHSAKSKRGMRPYR